MVQQVQARRRALRWLAAGAAGGSTLALWGCGGGGDAGSSAASTTGTTGTTGTGTTGTGTTGTTTSSCTLIPEETAGPYPGDGSNSSSGGIANALALSGIVRSDIRSSIAGASGVAGGVPLQVVLQLVNTNGGCASLAGYAIYLWHCDREGRYSMYSSGVTAENYLRGVQVTGSDGTASFSTVFPGCYSGRVPHIHFEVYRSATTATSFSNKLRTSQLALPRDVSSTVYSTASGYSASVANLAAISFSTDNVFSDGVATQLATVTGDTGSGFVARLQVGISV
jgi:protocatechuate 3,4-dioxygenase beta subunit